MIVYEPFKRVPIRDFVDELRFEFPNVPDDLFIHLLRKTAITMARKGHLVRRFAYLDSQPGVTRYRLSSPDGEEICGVHGIYAEACCGSHAVTRTFVEPEDDALCCAKDVAWYDDAEGVLHIDACHCGQRYRVAVSTAPGREACDLPEVFMQSHFDLLLLGTKAAIMLMAGRPWSNMRLGTGYHDLFSKQLLEAAVGTATHKQRGAVKMNFGRAI